MLGRDHLDTLDSMMNLALVFDLQGKRQEAEAAHRQTLAMQERVLGHEHPHTLVTIHHLGCALVNQGKYQEGEAMLRQVLVLSQKVHGLEHPRTLDCAGDIASELGRQGRWKEAEVMKREVLAIKEKVLGREHRSTLISAHDLASTLVKQGRYEEAEAIYRQTLATEEDVLGLEHPKTLTSMNYLAYLLAKRGCYGESLALFDRAYAGRTNVLGGDHPDTRRCYRNRSAFASWERAESTAIRERDLAGIRDLANRLGTYKHHGMATALYDKACAKFQKVLGEDHPATRECFEDCSRLAAWLQARTAAEAETTSTPFDEKSVASLETGSGVSPRTEKRNGLEARSVEGTNVAAAEPTNGAEAASLMRTSATQEQTPAADFSAVTDGNTTLLSGKVSMLSRGLAKLHIRSFRNKRE